MPASPTAPTTSAQVQIVLARLAKSNEQLTEKYNLAQINVDKAQKAAAAAATQAQQAKIALTVARRALANSLAAQYKGSSFSRTAALLASDSGQNYIEKMQSLTFLAMHQKEVSSVAAQALATSVKAEAKATSLVASAVVQRADVAKQRDALSGEIDKQRKLFDSLSAAERAAFLARQAPAPTKTQLQSVQTPVAPAAAKSNGAAAAVAAAMSQRGKPYVWGAAGPDSYDCSGLTMWAWAQAGVSLPHQSAEQQGLGTPVSQDQLQPGDLVFFGSPAYHVGMYIGNGMMVHAPTTGDVVKVSPLAYMSDYSGATRVG
jgi:cell wall-associated NlpC family hydrolase